jgi:hypothetical protein
MTSAPWPATSVGCCASTSGSGTPPRWSATRHRADDRLCLRPSASRRGVPSGRRGRAAAGHRRLQSDPVRPAGVAFRLPQRPQCGGNAGRRARATVPAGVLQRAHLRPSAITDSDLDSDLESYVSAYAAPGAICAGFEPTAPSIKTQRTIATPLKRNGKLTAPVLAVGGATSTSGPLIDQMMREVAETVTAVRMPRTAPGSLRKSDSVHGGLAEVPGAGPGRLARAGPGAATGRRAPHPTACSAPASCGARWSARPPPAGPAAAAHPGGAGPLHRSGPVRPACSCWATAPSLDRPPSKTCRARGEVARSWKPRSASRARRRACNDTCCTLRPIGRPAPSRCAAPVGSHSGPATAGPSPDAPPASLPPPPAATPAPDPAAPQTRVSAACTCQSRTPSTAAIQGMLCCHSLSSLGTPRVLRRVTGLKRTQA